ncbi:DUF1833 domain-containing protein [Xylophilus rhododendri]|uniref:DUF1833 domain-containing protein n=1 Tax=Xylophilus rhododendri TaxID=2697032 RepID=A0A857J9F6_9BURK|nr:DUF1833 family protein [Xylophilus rhododendri]QHI99368.1 DUF1833 domain-containing protein [Xylophilus rhododendri]
MTLTPQMRAQLQRVNDRDGVLLFLAITHRAFAAPVRVVRDTRKCPRQELVDGVLQTVTYLPLPIEITLPQDVPREQARVQIQMDNVGRDVLSELEALPAGAALDVTVFITSRASPQTVDWDFTAAMTKATATYGSIAITIGDDSLFRAPAVALRYDAQTAPGLF